MTERCPICLEELWENIGTAIPCGHCYHRDCFAQLKHDSEQRTADVLELALLQRCCICKKKVKKFMDIYLSMERPTCASKKDDNYQDYEENEEENDDDAFSSHSHQQQVEEELQELRSTNERLQTTLAECQSLSSEQSQVLCRLIPKLNQCEETIQEYKHDNQVYQQKLSQLQDENADLQWDVYHGKTNMIYWQQQALALEQQLELAAVQQMTMEQQFQSSCAKRKAIKHKVKHLVQEQLQALRTVQEHIMTLLYTTTNTTLPETETMEEEAFLEEEEESQEGKDHVKQQKKRRRASTVTTSSITSTSTPRTLANNTSLSARSMATSSATDASLMTMPLSCLSRQERKQSRHERRRGSKKNKSNGSTSSNSTPSTSIASTTTTTTTAPPILTLNHDDNDGEKKTKMNYNKNKKKRKIHVMAG